MSSWIEHSVASAVSFALGDFIVVKNQIEGSDPVSLFLCYTLLMGVFVSMLLYLNKDYNTQIKRFSLQDWRQIVVISIIFLVAYYTHYKALLLAPNPGYANSLVMFHVALLAMLSYLFLGRPLNTKTTIGIGLMFVGSFMIIKYSG